jgi:anion-transporting  ArsA/GET3 family ATPase
MERLSMEKLNQKTVLFLGTGGVGKTTLASLYALKKAKEDPSLKIKLVTIDPSERLRDYFSMKDSESVKAINNLTVAINEREALFKSFVEESLGHDPRAVDSVYQNKIFQKLLGGLAVSQEFTSLYEIVKSHKEGYDLLVVDTPPLQNAGSFLSGAEILRDLFSSMLSKFFIPAEKQGVLFSLFFSARKKGLEMLARLTGQGFVTELSEFFLAVEKIRPLLLDTLKESQKIIHEQAHIIGVCNNNELSLGGLKLSLKSFEEKNLKMNECFVNKFGLAPERALAVQTKISEIQQTYPQIKFRRISKFEIQPKNNEDLLEVEKNVEF